MDIGQRLKAAARRFYLHQVGTRPTSGSTHDSSPSSETAEVRPGPTLEKPVINNEIRDITDTIQGMDERVLKNVLALLGEARHVHRKDPMNGHKLADRVLLQIINNDEVTKAYNDCC